MKKILFTGGGGVGNEALWRLLKNKYDIFFGDINISLIDPIIPKKKRIKIKKPSNSDFIKHLNHICTIKKIDLIIPTVDEELKILSDNEEHFYPKKILLPDKNYINFALDKMETYQKLKRFSIDVPSTFQITNFTNELKFPVIIKPRSGRGSRNVFVAKKKEFGNLKKYLLMKKEKFIVQEKIIGQEFTVQMIADENKNIHAIVPVKVNLKKGVTISAEVSKNCSVLNACLKIHNFIPTKGCYNIQLILDKNNKVYPFEINPRISTTFCLTIACGIDPIEIFLDRQETNFLLKYSTKMKLRRHLKNHIL